MRKEKKFKKPLDMIILETEQKISMVTQFY